jgi:hypothetical protein
MLRPMTATGTSSPAARSGEGFTPATMGDAPEREVVRDRLWCEGEA